MTGPSETGSGTCIEDIVLLFGCFSRGQDNLDEVISKLRTNASCIFQPDPGVFEEDWVVDLPDGAILTESCTFCLTLSEMPKDRKAWVFGSSVKEPHYVNDFWLAEDNSRRISKHHFAVDLVSDGPSDTAVPRITFRSTTSSLMIEDAGVSSVLLEQPGDSVNIKGPRKLIFPDHFSFWVWTPPRNSIQQRVFTMKANRFVERLKKELPEHIASISNEPDTMDADLRFDQDGHIYSQNPESLRNVGPRGSVFRVLKDEEDTGLVAKEFYSKPYHTALSVRMASEEMKNQLEIGKEVWHPNLVNTYGIAWPREKAANFVGPWLLLENVPLLLFDPEAQDPEPYPLLLGLAGGLRSIHENGFIHGNLNPETIRAQRVGPICQPKIDNIGSAVRQSGPVSRLAGMPGYIAPEVLDDPMNYDARVDVYALGIIYLMKLTKYTPGDHSYQNLVTYADHVAWVVDVAGPLIGAAPVKFRPLLHAMLAPDPQWRWTSQQVLKFLSHATERKRKLSQRCSALCPKRVCREESSDRVFNDERFYAAHDKQRVGETDTQHWVHAQDTLPDTLDPTPVSRLFDELWEAVREANDSENDSDKENVPPEKKHVENCGPCVADKGAMRKSDDPRAGLVTPCHIQDDDSSDQEETDECSATRYSSGNLPWVRRNDGSYASFVARDVCVEEETFKYVVYQWAKRIMEVEADPWCIAPTPTGGRNGDDNGADEFVGNYGYDYENVTGANGAIRAHAHEEGDEDEVEEDQGVEDGEVGWMTEVEGDRAEEGQVDEDEEVGEMTEVEEENEVEEVGDSDVDINDDDDYDDDDERTTIFREDWAPIAPTDLENDEDEVVLDQNETQSTESGNFGDDESDDVCIAANSI
ncbi:hypothetical protein F5Y14DRAFT_447049 [Nemania sp. NC0429]|nr:hypothetical protein F5Y14DRAFT_447049 [Nemania sp. NC0429]